MPSKPTSSKAAGADAPADIDASETTIDATTKLAKSRAVKPALAAVNPIDPKLSRTAMSPAPAPSIAPATGEEAGPVVAAVTGETAVPAPAAAPKPTAEPQFRSPPKMPGHMPGMHGRPQIAPRAMAAKENFVEGDYVVYPTHGVGKVERIATEEIAGHKLELIHITFEENRMTLRVPVAKARTAGLRKLATRALFDKALALMKGRARIKRTMWSRRAQEYEQKINSGDPLQIAEVVRDLYRNAGQPDQSFSERQIYENAMDRLAAEYAALEKTDKATAMQRLLDDLKTVVKGAAIEVDAEGEEVEPVEPA